MIINSSSGSGFLPTSGGTVTGNISIPNATYSPNYALTGKTADDRYGWLETTNLAGNVTSVSGGSVGLKSFSNQIRANAGAGNRASIQTLLTFENGAYTKQTTGVCEIEIWFYLNADARSLIQINSDVLSGWVSGESNTNCYGVIIDDGSLNLITRISGVQTVQNTFSNSFAKIGTIYDNKITYKLRMSRNNSTGVVTYYFNESLLGTVNGPAGLLSGSLGISTTSTALAASVTDINIMQVRTKQ